MSVSPNPVAVRGGGWSTCGLLPAPVPRTALPHSGSREPASGDTNLGIVRSLGLLCIYQVNTLNHTANTRGWTGSAFAHRALMLPCRQPKRCGAVLRYKVMTPTHINPEHKGRAAVWLAVENSLKLDE